MRSLILSMFALSAITALMTAGEYLTSKQYGFDSDTSMASMLRIVLLATATYAGITCQVLTARLKRSKEKRISIKNEFREMTASSDFWIAILASPLLLVAAYGAIAQVTSIVLVCSIGFQNGYFFHSILSKQERTSE